MVGEWLKKVYLKEQVYRINGLDWFSRGKEKWMLFETC